MNSFTDQEVVAICQVLNAYAKEHREDLIGAFMLTGGFTFQAFK